MSDPVGGQKSICTASSDFCPPTTTEHHQLARFGAGVAVRKRESPGTYWSTPKGATQTSISIEEPAYWGEASRDSVASLMSDSRRRR
jgi:hypothetical protein